MKVNREFDGHNDLTDYLNNNIHNKLGGLLEKVKLNLDFKDDPVPSSEKYVSC